jgi:hypothetical protein
MGAPSTAPAWLAPLEAGAPDVVAAWNALGNTFAGVRALRRALRERVTDGDALRILAQQEVVADALAGVLDGMPEAALRAPGGEEDWNVAQAFAHTTAARRFLPAWAALAASGSWSTDEPPVVRPSVPGDPGASREALHALLEKSRRSQARSAAQIEGHETARCPLEHPLVGRLRCGDWLLFAGVHDLMHLEQLHRIAVEFGIPQHSRADG